MAAGCGYSFPSGVCWAQQQSLCFCCYCTLIQKSSSSSHILLGRRHQTGMRCVPLKQLWSGGGGAFINSDWVKTSGLSQAHGSAVNTHLVELSSESDCSDCSRAWDASEGAGSGSGFRIRNKRKQPTRLITVREMNTVWRSLSETPVTVFKLELLLWGPHWNWTLWAS